MRLGTNKGRPAPGRRARLFRASPARRVAAIAAITLLLSASAAGSVRSASATPGPAHPEAAPAAPAANDPPPGSVYAWGRNSSGQLGNGTTTASSAPLPVSLPPGTLVTELNAGRDHSLALTSTGQVLAWGYNAWGQLGNGTTTSSSVPVTVSLPPGTTVTAIVGGNDFSVALTSTGQVYVWGYGSQGQLGNGILTNTDVPVLASIPSGTTITAVAAGVNHVLALTSTGQVLAWGFNTYGQIGDGPGNVGQFVSTPVPVSLPTGTTVTAVGAGADHSLAVTSTGQVLAWGNNGSGELGNGTTVSSDVPVFASLPPATTVTAVAGGSDHSLAVTSTGQVLAWGNNGSGRLGNGSDVNSSVPVFASLPSGTTVTAVAAGASDGAYSLALTAAGQVLAWGAGAEGQLGDGATADSSVPVTVSLPLGAFATAIGAGAAHGLAVVAAELPIAKTADVQSFANAGDVITYTYTVANRGVSQVNNLVISDSILPGGIACTLGTFIPGASATCQASYQTTPADVAGHGVTNSAVAGGNLSGGLRVQGNTVSLTIPLIEHPAIAIAKTADVTSFARAGDVIRYTYTVSNDGDVPLHGVTVDDSQLGAQSCLFSAIPAPGSASCTVVYTVTPADVSAHHIANTATAAGTTPGGTVVTSPAAGLDIPLTEHPAIAIEKTADVTSYARAGQPITYTYTVTNNGDVPLHGVTVDDSQLGAQSCLFSAIPAPGSASCAVSYTVTPADVAAGRIANTATATGTTPGGTVVVTSPAAGLDIPLIEHPAIAIVKQASVNSFTAAGQVVAYTYTVTNNGDVPLHDVTVDDSKLGAVCGASFTLPLAGKRTCTARHVTTAADVAAGRIANTATVTGATPSAAGAPAAGTVQAQAPGAPAAGTVQAQVALVIMLRAVPGISITRHANVTSFAAAGTVITYTYTVTNTGNVSLHAVAVADSKVGTVTCPAVTLPVGASMTCTARYTATTGDVSAGYIASTATVTGTTTTGTRVTSKASLAVKLFVPVTG